MVGLDPSVKPPPDERLVTLVVDLEKELRETGAYFPMRSRVLWTIDVPTVPADM